MFRSVAPSSGNKDHRVETYRDVTDRRKHCGRLRYHVPTFFQATGAKNDQLRVLSKFKVVVIRSSSNQMHASSNLPSAQGSGYTSYVSVCLYSV
jgi:hypothetical protein